MISYNKDELMKNIMTHVQKLLDMNGKDDFRYGLCVKEIIVNEKLPNVKWEECSIFMKR
jgi:hypothetical protein